MIYITKQNIFLQLFVCLLLANCSKARTRIDNRFASINKEHFNIKTTMSAPIFLDPILEKQKILYFEYKNTSGNSEIDIKKDLIFGLIKKGVLITNINHFIDNTKNNVLNLNDQEKKYLIDETIKLSKQYFANNNINQDSYFNQKQFNNIDITDIAIAAKINHIKQLEKELEPFIVLQVYLSYAGEHNKSLEKNIKGKDLFNNIVTGTLIGGTIGFSTEQPGYIAVICGLASLGVTYFLHKESPEYLLTADIKISQKTSNPISSDNITTITSGVDSKEYIKWQDNKTYKAFQVKIEKTLKTKSYVISKFQLLQKSMSMAIIEMF